MRTTHRTVLSITALLGVMALSSAAPRTNPADAPATTDDIAFTISPPDFHHDAVEEFNAGRDEVFNEQYVEAAKHLRRALQFSSLEADAADLAIESRYWLAYALLMQGNVTDAEPEMRRAVGEGRRVLADKPDLLSLMMASLAGLRLELNDDTSAAALAEESYRVAHDPSTLARAAFFAGLAHYRLQDNATAAEWLGRALRSFAEEPDDPQSSGMRGTAARHLADIQWFSKMFCEAQRNYELALSLPGTSPTKMAEMRVLVNDIKTQRLCTEESLRRSDKPPPSTNKAPEP